MRPLVARGHLGLGRLYRRTVQGDEAQRHLALATAMFREMGMRIGRPGEHGRELYLAGFGLT